MELNNLLAQLANHTHYDLVALQKTLPPEIKDALLTNDTTNLKKRMGEKGIVAHRDMVAKY